MTERCPDCFGSLADRAKFCSRCGKPVTPLPPPPSKGPSREEGVWPAALVPLLVILVAGALFWRSTTPHCPVGSATRSKTFCLEPHKAGAVHDLLRPEDVPVGVEIRQGNLVIEGTEGEVRAIEGFVELLRSDNQQGDQDSGWADSELLSRSYRLSRENAARLDNVLSFADVPVFSISAGSSVTVMANEGDHDTIMQVVRILGGTRLN